MAIENTKQSNQPCRGFMAKNVICGTFWGKLDGTPMG